MFNAVSVHPLHNSLVLVGRKSRYEDNVAIFIGKVVPVARSPAHVVNVKAAIGDIGSKHTFREKTDPSIRSPASSNRIGVGDGGLVVKNNILICP